MKMAPLGQSMSKEKLGILTTQSLCAELEKAESKLCAAQLPCGRKRSPGTKFTPHGLAWIIFDISRKLQALKHLSLKDQQKKSPGIARGSDERAPPHPPRKQQFLQP